MITNQATSKEKEKEKKERNKIKNKVYEIFRTLRVLLTWMGHLI
jgi:hypothetical protein